MQRKRLAFKDKHFLNWG